MQLNRVALLRAMAALAFASSGLSACQNAVAYCEWGLDEQTLFLSVSPELRGGNLDVAGSCQDPTCVASEDAGCTAWELQWVAASPVTCDVTIHLGDGATVKDSIDWERRCGAHPQPTIEASVPSASDAKGGP